MPRTLPPPNGQKFIAVTSRQLSGPHGKLMQMPGEARVEETGTEAESYPIIVRSFEPVADLAMIKPDEAGHFSRARVLRQPPVAASSRMP